MYNSQPQIIVKSKVLTNKFLSFIASFLLIFSFILFFGKNSFADEHSIPNINSTEFLTTVNNEKGKIVLVNFFASWCPPCKEEVVDLNEVRAKYNTDEVYIIGLSLDEDPKALEKFLETTPLSYPVYRADFEIAFAYNVSSIPHNVIYGKDLKAVYSQPGIVDAKFLSKVFDTELAK